MNTDLNLAKDSNLKNLQIFTDGACSGNPGPGGWGAILKWGGKTKEISGYCEHTTNNRMELSAAINALKQVKKNVKITLSTDSIYVKDGITKWIITWKKNNWKKVKNIDLWQELDELNAKFDVTWLWIKGHNQHPENERCDELARDAIKKNRI